MRPTAFPKKLLQLAATAAVNIERFVRPRSKVQPGRVKSVLVPEYIIPLGNCVHTTPLFEAIKHARPELTVIVATWGIGLDVLRNSPYVDHLIETPNMLKNFWGAVISLRRQLRERGLSPDCCLIGCADARTKIGIYAALVSSGWRGGFTLLPPLFQRPLDYDSGKSLIANNLRLAGLLGIEPGELEPKIFYTRADAEVARKLMDEARANGRPVLVVISRNSGGLPTAWHEERWAETVRYAHDRLGYSVIYAGTASDRTALAELTKLAGGIGISGAGRTDIRQLSALIALSDMVISIATGGAHVARSVGTPLLLLGLAWEKPLQWFTEGLANMRIIRGPDVEKAPPGYRLDEITVEWATHELAEMTKLFPPDAEARETRLRASLSEIDHLLA